MKLSALLISNFKGIKEEVKTLIDNVVILIGPNNCSSQQYWMLMKHTTQLAPA